MKNNHLATVKITFIHTVIAFGLFSLNLYLLNILSGSKTLLFQLTQYIFLFYFIFSLAKLLVALFNYILKKDKNLPEVINPESSDLNLQNQKNKTSKEIVLSALTVGVIFFVVVILFILFALRG